MAARSGAGEQGDRAKKVREGIQDAVWRARGRALRVSGLAQRADGVSARVAAGSMFKASGPWGAWRKTNGD
jgi:hypothetical protein